MTALSIEGPKAGEFLSAMGAPTPDAAYSNVDWKGRIVARVSSTGAPGFRIFAPAGEKAALIGDLAMADAESARVARLEHAKPRYGDDIFDTTLPQETQQAHALHFSKGCYIGQEIVERIRSRGHVNRLLMGLRFERLAGEPAADPGVHPPVTSGGAQAGEITSAAYSPAL